MNEVGTASHINYAWSEQDQIGLPKIGFFVFENATSDLPYNLPSYLTYLVIKHSELPTPTYYSVETIELDNVDFVLGDEEIEESEELINTQNEHDAYFLRPFNINTKRKTKVIFK